MSESASILRYIAASQNLTSLYPEDPALWHKVDSVLDFFGTSFWPKLEKHYLKTRVGPAFGHIKLPWPKI